MAKRELGGTDGDVSNDMIGRDGMGLETYTKYPAEGAKVTLNGGNTPIQDGIRTSAGEGNKIDTLSDGFGQ